MMIAIFNFLSLLYHVKERKNSSKRIYRCYISINALLILFNLPRGLVLFIDPYNSNVNDLFISQGISFLFWGSTVPCFTSAFILMNLALLDITKVQLYPTKLQNLKLIASIVTANFLLALSFDLTAILKQELNWILYICQAFFLLLGILLATAMLYTGFKVLKKLRDSARSVRSFDLKVSPEIKSSNTEFAQRSSCDVDENVNIEISYTGNSQNVIRPKEVKDSGTHRANWKSKTFRRGTRRLTIITMVTSVAAITYSLVQVYSFLAVYPIRDSTKPIHPWHWFAYQTMARLLEAVMSVCMSYVVRMKDVTCCC